LFFFFFFFFFFVSFACQVVSITATASHARSSHGLKTCDQAWNALDHQHRLRNAAPLATVAAL